MLIQQHGGELENDPALLHKGDGLKMPHVPPGMEDLEDAGNTDESGGRPENLRKEALGGEEVDVDSREDDGTNGGPTPQDGESDGEDDSARKKLPGGTNAGTDDGREDREDVVDTEEHEHSHPGAKGGEQTPAVPKSPSGGENVEVEEDDGGSSQDGLQSGEEDFTDLEDEEDLAQKAQREKEEAAKLQLAAEKAQRKAELDQQKARKLSQASSSTSHTSS